MIESRHDPRETARRLELILQELESLPTLGAVAVRLLELTDDAESESREVIDLVASDPALSARVLRMCRCHERGRASDVATIDRAVLLLGFDALRAAVLSVQVFDALDAAGSPSGEAPVDSPSFDREAYWLHSLATAVVSEAIARKARRQREVPPGEAFMAGLLHDLGQLVLHVLLPQTFDRVCRMAETHGASLDRACRELVGVDTHTVGKRLAEHWGLPERLVHAIWLNGQPPEAMPSTPHRGLVSVVTLADAIVRASYISAGGQTARTADLDALAIPVGVTTAELDEVVSRIHEEVARRADALGLRVGTDPRVLLRAVMRANRSLERANAGMRQRERIAFAQAQLVDALRSFLGSVRPDQPFVDVLVAVAASVRSTFGGEVAAALFRTEHEAEWQFLRFGRTGRAFGLRGTSVPDAAAPPHELVRDLRGLVPAATALPWIGDMMDAGFDLAAHRVLPLAPPGAQVSAMLVVDGGAEGLERPEDYAVLADCWAWAIEHGALHDDATHVAERLAEANRTLREMNELVARARATATLGEVAKGAAHEMNNPLAVIAGRAQLLANRVGDDDLRRGAAEIVGEAKRLSGMITALKSFAEPVIPERRSTDLADLVLRVVQTHGPGERRQPRVNTVFAEPFHAVWLDPGLFGAALGELVRNATESKGARHIEIRVQIDPADDRLKVEVRDDGSGLSETALRHAFDPFFSEKPAGRQPGLGLARANRYVEAHGGRITIANLPSGGAVATIWLPDWRPAAADDASRPPTDRRWSPSHEPHPTR